jgi:6-phosphogluconolactonase
MAKLTLVPSRSDLTAYAANQFLSFFANSTEAVFIALSGGSTPRGIYEEIAKRADQYNIRWPLLHFFWGDERCVPPDNPDSNYTMAMQAMLSALPVPEANIHRIIGEADPEVEAKRYDEELRVLLPKNMHGVPCFDWIHLGIGEDGHTASLFPQSDALSVTDQMCTVTRHPNSGQQRITVTFPVLLASTRITLFATGTSKTDILAAAMRGGEDKYPAARILRSHPSVEVIADEAAASKLGN